MSGARTPWTMAVKRLMDVSGSLVGLIVLSPLLLLLSVLIRMTLGRPIFFRQVRAGQGGRPFRLWKFRTMTEAQDSSGRMLPDEERVTKLGSFIRSYSLDELPQLFNVLLGNMSLVGPRPLLLRYVDRYNDRQRLRLTVKPGVTGLAQVNGRNALDWDSRLELDAVYAEQVSLALDLRLLLKTVWKVARREGAAGGAGTIVEEFRGTSSGPAADGTARFPVKNNEPFRTSTAISVKRVR